MAQRNISFIKCDNESYVLVDQYLFGSRFHGYEYFYNYYNNSVNNIPLYKKTDNEYVIRYIGANKSIFAAL